MKCFEVDARRHLAKLRRVSFVTTLSTRLSKGHDAELERALAGLKGGSGPVAGRGVAFDPGWEPEPTERS